MTQTTWPNDIHHMHEHFGHLKTVSHFDLAKMEKLLGFRIRFLKEEMNEMCEAVEDEDAEKFVDSIIDLCVVAIGTLDMFGVDVQKAWDEVHRANMQKQAGENPNRENGIGLPDLYKPEGWTPPCHKDNVGRLGVMFE